jgi:hypothetical protein
MAEGDWRWDDHFRQPADADFLRRSDIEDFPRAAGQFCRRTSASTVSWTAQKQRVWRPSP